MYEQEKARAKQYLTEERIKLEYMQAENNDIVTDMIKS